MADPRDLPADLLIDKRIDRLADRIDALEAGDEEISRMLDEVAAATARLSKPKLRVVKEGDDA